MILEELVALIGFKVEGQNDLKKAATWFDRLKLKILGFAKAVQTRLKAAFGRLGEFGGRAGAAIARGVGALVSGLARLSVIAVGAAAGLTAIGVAGAGIVGVVAAVAAGIASVGGRIAQARREMQLFAQGMGTTARGMDAITNAFQLIGGSNEKTARKRSEGFVEGVRDVQEEAILGDAEARKKFSQNGLSPTDPDGKTRDASALSLDVVNRRYDLAAKRNAAKGAKAVQAAERQVAKFDKDFGIKGDTKALLDSVPSKEEFARRFQDANNRNPTQTTDQENRSQQVGEQWSKLQLAIDALTEPFSRLAVIVAGELLPALVAFAEMLVSFGQRLGIINETQGQIDARKRSASNYDGATSARTDELEKAVGASSDLERAQKMLAIADANVKRLLVSTDSPDAARALTSARAEAEFWKGRLNTLTPPAAAGAGVPLPVPRPPEAPTGANEAPSWLTEVMGLFKDLITSAPAVSAAVSPEVNGAKVGQAQETKNVTISNTGNDQRTVSVSVSATVNSVPELGPVVQNATASALAKSSNAQTAPVPGP